MNQSDFLQRFQYNTRADLIGGGGFGKVYRAYDDLRDRYVAIKIAEVTDGYEHLSLKKEAELSHKLSVHKNIAYYEDCFRFEMPNGLYDYGILQYYPDGNLSEFIKKTNLTETQKDQIAIGIINGLNFLHTNNIVHRDLKPSNVLITQKEHEVVPKITDFGLSKAVENINVTFKTNSFIGGSIKYSAPEQLLNTKTKGNVDIWSLGVIMFEIFVGKVPFDVDSENGSTDYQRIESLRKITEGRVPIEIESIPEPYKNIIKNCLIVDPEVRLQSIDHVLSILEGFKTENESRYSFDDRTIIISKKGNPEKFDLNISKDSIDSDIEAKDAESLSHVDTGDFVEKTEIIGEIALNDLAVPAITVSPIEEDGFDEISNNATISKDVNREENEGIDQNPTGVDLGPAFATEIEMVLTDIETGPSLESPSQGEQIGDQNQISEENITNESEVIITETASIDPVNYSEGPRSAAKHKPKSKSKKQNIASKVSVNIEQISQPAEIVEIDNSLNLKPKELESSPKKSPNESSISKLTFNLEKGLEFVKNNRKWIGIGILLLSLFWVGSGPSLQIIQEKDKYFLRNSNGSLANNKEFDKLEKSFWNGFSGQISDTVFTINRNGNIVKFEVFLPSQDVKTAEKNKLDSIQKVMLSQNEAAWVKSSQANTLDAYEKFVANNPSSQYIELAKDKIKILLDQANTGTDESLWAYALKNNSISAYQMYLEEFPKGRQIVSCKQKIKALNLKNDEELWSKTINNNSALYYNEYLRAYPNGIHANDARNFVLIEENAAANRNRNIDKKVGVPNATIQANDAVISPLEQNVTELDKTSIKIDDDESSFLKNLSKNFVRISGGSFTIGCEGEDCPKDAKGGIRTIVDGFFISKYEVTQELYADVMGKNPSETRGCGSCPVENISFKDMSTFIQKLNQMPGNKYKYRLPSELEWEYAASGNENKEFSGSNDLEKVGASKLDNLRWTLKVGSKQPNAFGLYDMSGNVYEVCRTGYTPTGYGGNSNGKFVIRGGSWNSNFDKCKVKTRSSFSSTEKSPAIGFRLVHD